MLNEFVDKVLVHRAEKIDGRRTQKVEVYLNFVGMIDFPEPEKTPEELEQEALSEKRHRQGAVHAITYVEWFELIL